ncbi:proline racemase family protein [Rhodococcus sp. NPDC049939]|uniref:proline racemase family protein n=1 Tax=Rhodococcus sp. NPDC049939 TaxID=3155511 RepID=UPI0033D8EEC5
MSRRTINTIDVHAAGEPGRVLIGSHLQVKGATMADRLEYCREHLEDLRLMLLHEPRGYPGLCAVLVLPPVHADSDFGIVVVEQGGFRPMSGSNLICAVTAVLETGTLTVTEPTTTLRVDTAVGAVHVLADIDGGRVTRVTFDNVPAFVVAIDHPLEVPGYGTVPVDIVFGGQFFVQARAADLGIDLVPGAARELTRAGAVLRTVAQRSFPVAHSDNPDINQVDLTMIHGPSPTSGVSGRNAVVLPNGVVDLDDPTTWTGALDRSPCGTGTCGRMAALHARGELALGEPFVHESLLGTTFTGVLRGETAVAGRTAVLPSVSGRGWITAFNQLVLDSDDPFPCGYAMGDLWGSQTVSA